MKTLKSILAITSIILFTACNFNKSVSKSLITGLSTKGNGLSVDEVYMTNGIDKLESNTLLYGQEIYTYFDNIEGFVVEDGKIFPDMQVVVLSKVGDTVLQNKNLLDGKGIKGTKAVLNGNVILAYPIYSDDEYTIKYTIIDTKGSGVFSSEFDLKLEKDPLIKIKEKGLSVKEAYIFNQNSRTIITNGKVDFNNTFLFDLHGLKGYKLANGKPNLGMSVKVTDSKGGVILDMENLLKNSFLTETQIKKGLGSTLKLSKGTLVNPLLWQVHIWDKNSDAELVAESEITVEN